MIAGYRLSQQGRDRQHRQLSPDRRTNRNRIGEDHLLQGRLRDQIVRGAGTSAQIMAKEGDSAHIKLPSGEVRLVNLDCRATIGQIGNIEHESLILGKAGKSRWLGIKPSVRGVAMNPVDHPHGGGEGKSGQGNPHPVTPWGMPTKGYRTRNRKKYSNKFIVKRRKP